jgi:hypothetical protein
MDLLEWLGLGIRVLALLGFLVVLIKTQRLRRMVWTPPGWKRGWLAVLIISVVLSLRAILFIIDALIPSISFFDLLSHQLAMAVVGLLISLGLNGLIFELSRIFEDVHLNRQQEPSSGDDG